MPYYTQHVFCLTYFVAWRGGVPKNREYPFKTRYPIPLERLPFIQIFTRRSVYVTVESVPVTHISTQETRGNIIVPPVVKLRHTKVVVSRQYSRKKPVSGMHSSRYRIVLCLYFPRRPFGEIWAVCFGVAVVPDSVAVVVRRSSASSRDGT